MMHDLIQGILTDILSFLSQHRNFFGLEEAARQELLAGASLPPLFQKVLLTLDEAGMMKEIDSVQQYLSGGPARGIFLASVGVFCARDLGNVLDSGDITSYQGAFARSLQQIVSTYSYQEVAQEVQHYLESCSGNVPYIVVQSPFALDASFRSDIRAHFATTYKLCFPLFSVNKNLIGGIRVFIDGETRDLSWISRLNALGNVLYSRV